MTKQEIRSLKKGDQIKVNGAIWELEKDVSDGYADGFCVDPMESKFRLNSHYSWYDSLYLESSTIHKRAFELQPETPEQQLNQIQVEEVYLKDIPVGEKFFMLAVRTKESAVALLEDGKTQHQSLLQVIRPYKRPQYEPIAGVLCLAELPDGAKTQVMPVETKQGIVYVSIENGVQLTDITNFYKL